MHAQKYFHYNLATGLYMLEPWEKALFNTVAGGITLATLYYTYGYVEPWVEYFSDASGSAPAARDL